MPFILPEYSGERSRFRFIISCVFLFNKISKFDECCDKKLFKGGKEFSLEIAAQAIVYLEMRLRKLPFTLYDFDKIIAVSRFKGHAQAGFGGALKQIGIGCVTKKNKFLAHNENMLSVNPKKCNISLCRKECIDACSVDAIRIEGESSVIDPSKCIGCFNCRSACPIKNAINRPNPNNVENFVERVIDNAFAVLKSFGPENIRFINFAIEVTGQCDCIPNTNMPIVPDLGIFGSSDPVAIDKACMDAEINAPGLPFLKPNGEWTQPEAPGIEKFKKMYTMVDTNLQFQAALKNKIGTTNYKLVNIL